jgi:hypothetical protein
MAPMNSLNATASCSIRSSAMSLKPSASLCTAGASVHPGERVATFWSNAAEAARTAAAAEPLAGAGAPEAILLSR